MKELSQHGLPALLLTFLTEERTRNHRHCGGPADQVRFRELAPGQNALGATRRHEDVRPARGFQGAAGFTLTAGIYDGLEYTSNLRVGASDLLENK